MSGRALEFVIPGDLWSATGGYVYDRAMMAGLRARGWQLRVHALDASFPHPTPGALAQAKHVFSQLPDDACVLVDGLALGAMPELIEAHALRLSIVALLHMPLAAEFGIAHCLAEQLRRQERQALKFVRHVIVTSAVTQHALTADGIDASLVSIVEPGVCASAPVRRSGGTRDAVSLLCVATVQEGKGHALLIDALAPLAHLPWHLHCVGSVTRSAATVRELMQQLQRLRLLDRVTFAGELPHSSLGPIYLGADLFVLATFRESYGMAVAESLAHGVPVISTRTGAIPQLLDAGGGLLVEPGDREGLQQALERTVTDEALRSSLRAGALAARQRLALWPQACERMALILERICEPRVPVRARGCVEPW